MNKLKVGIFMGGMSVEKEVSFNSGRTVYDHIDKTVFDPILIFQNSNGILYRLPYKFLYRGKIADFENRLEAEAQRMYWDDIKKNIDFAFIAMHGRFAEDGILQGMLEVLQIPYLGSKIFGSAVSRDKFLVYDFLTTAGIRVPKHKKIMLNDLEKLEEIVTEVVATIGFPCVVKPHKEGSSFGVSIACSATELHEAIKHAVYCSNIPQPIIIEEKIIGKEFISTVITDVTGSTIALPPTEIVLEERRTIFDYDQKYMPGRAIKFTPARFPVDTIECIKNLTIKIMDTLSLKTMVRVDGFLTEANDIVFIDVNSITGMAPSSFFFSQTAEIGLNHAQVINMLIKAELHNYTIDF